MNKLGMGAKPSLAKVAGKGGKVKNQGEKGYPPPNFESMNTLSHYQKLHQLFLMVAWDLCAKHSMPEGVIVSLQFQN